MDDLKTKFCNALNKWQKTQSYGAITRLAKETGLSQGAISNVLAGRRAGTEEWRRKVAKAINIPYDEMIGVVNHAINNIHHQEAETLKTRVAELNQQLHEKEKQLEWAQRSWETSESMVKILLRQIEGTMDNQKKGGGIIQNGKTNN